MPWEIISSAIEMLVNYRETNIATVLQPQVFRMTNMANQCIGTATRSCTFVKANYVTKLIAKHDMSEKHNVH